MDVPANYEPFTPETLGQRLAGVSAVTERLGNDPSAWRVEEVGDGNLNLVFIVTSADAALVVKQALPYVRLVGESWPLPLSRSFYEYQALSRQAKRDPGMVPQLLHHDESQALVVMEYLAGFKVLRGKLIAGERVSGLGERLGLFCARTAFRGSDLAMDAAERKADAALFLGNTELQKITEDLVFTNPYYRAADNWHTKGLGHFSKVLCSDARLKTEVAHLKRRYSAGAETMLHGDLHTGSVMCTDDECRVIDPEFALYGPMSFDLAMLTANLLMAYFSQPGHREEAECAPYQAWILKEIEALHAAFTKEFRRLWAEERSGMLYPASLFEDQGHESTAALQELLWEIWRDALGFCGIEMHRRLLSLAHNADFEEVADETLRLKLEARTLMMGRELILRRGETASAAELTVMARHFSGRDFT